MEESRITVPSGKFRAETTECVSHNGLDGVYECDKCDAPICESCYSAFTLEDEGEEYHFCANCYKEFVAAEAEEAISLKKMIVREFVGIALGMVVGFILGLAIAMDSGFVPMVIIFPLLGTFIGGSFVTIAKKIYNTYQLNKDTSGGESSWAFNLVIALFICAGYIIISPFTTIYRLIVRVQDRRALNAMIAQNALALITIDDFVERVGAEAVGSLALEAAAAGTDSGVEISIDDIIEDGFEIAENGEFLRKVRYR